MCSLLFSGLIPDFKDWKSVVMSILEEQDPHQYMDMRKCVQYPSSDEKVEGSAESNTR